MFFLNKDNLVENKLFNRLLELLYVFECYRVLLYNFVLVHQKRFFVDITLQSFIITLRRKYPVCPVLIALISTDEMKCLFTP